jgi:hypothetical protein
MVEGPHRRKADKVSEDQTRESYYVTMRSMENDYRRTERYSAHTFGEALYLAFKDLTKGEEIISIDRDYKV